MVFWGLLQNSSKKFKNNLQTELSCDCGWRFNKKRSPAEPSFPNVSFV